ncbi:MAG: NAD(+) synthase [Christensenellaceae bacterium]|jgi:NAD+ synthase
MNQRRILCDIAPDFCRDGESQETYLEKKRKEIIGFIKEYVLESGAKGLVLGISGGIDSFLCGCLCAEAAKELSCGLYLCILPNGQQADYKDAQDSIDIIRKIYPETKADTISIGEGYAGALKDLEASQLFDPNSAYAVGNIQARLRMVYQYAVAGGRLVVGTDHAAESVTGFFTKYGDGGVDLTPLQDLVKDDIYELSRQYGAPGALLEKQPAAGLGISGSDEEEMGVSYADICSYLKGNRIDSEVQQIIERMYARSAHKRALPASPKTVAEKLPPATHIVVDCLYKMAGGSYMAKSIANYINLHPQHMVLYVQRGSIRDEQVEQKIFCENVLKTTNSPLKRYNVFMGVDIFEAKNNVFGDLKSNLQHDIVLSGRWNIRMKETARILMQGGHTVTVLAYCLDDDDRVKYDCAHSEMEKLGARMLCNWMGG